MTKFSIFVSQIIDTFRYFSESGFIYFRHTLKLDEKKNAAHIQPQKIYPDIDLAETLSNLRGKWIKRVTAEEIEFQDGERISLKDLDWRLVKPLIWWS